MEPVVDPVMASAAPLTQLRVSSRCRLLLPRRKSRPGRVQAPPRTQDSSSGWWTETSIKRQQRGLVVPLVKRSVENFR